MWKSSPIPARSNLTFWVVLTSGAVCGAAVAATPAAPGVKEVPAVEAPRHQDVEPIPEAPAAPSADMDPIPEVPEAAPIAAPEPAPRQLEEQPAPGEARPQARRVQEPRPEPAEEEPLVLKDGPIGATDPASEPPSEPEARAEGGGGFSTLIALVALLVAGAAVFIHLRSRKDAGGADAEDMEILSSVRLAGRWPVSLVRVPGRILVVGATDKGVTLLAELDPDEGGSLVEEEDVPVFDLSSRLGAPEAQPGDEDDEVLTYGRPRPRRPVDRPATAGRRRAEAEDKDDVFLDHLLDRLADAKPAVIRDTEPESERDALRQRVQALRRGPTRM